MVCFPHISPYPYRTGAGLLEANLTLLLCVLRMSELRPAGVDGPAQLLDLRLQLLDALLRRLDAAFRFVSLMLRAPDARAQDCSQVALVDPRTPTLPGPGLSR